MRFQLKPDPAVKPARDDTIDYSRLAVAPKRNPLPLRQPQLNTIPLRPQFIAGSLQ